MEYTIRRAELEDISWILGQLQEFSKSLETKYGLYGDEKYSRDGIQLLIEKHLFLIAEISGTPIGFISGYFTPHLFNPDIRILCELFWWVVPEHRRSRAGSMLIKEYVDFGKQNAQWITMGLNRFTPIKEQSLLNRGFKHHETTYLMET